MDPIIFGLVVVLVINLLIYPIAYKLQTDKLTDITYALSFATIAVYGFVGGLSVTSVSKMILAALILLWAMRLGLFLLDRVSKMGRDARFDQIRVNPVRFLRFFLIQAVSAWIISLPFLFRLLQDPGIDSSLSQVTSIEWLGFVIAAFGGRDLILDRYFYSEYSCDLGGEMADHHEPYHHLSAIALSEWYPYDQAIKTAKTWI